jgi:2-polyprenyl-3-methyl-5-hydroxy-6-metoxy-1,4-benzoquinol methylase
MTSRTQSAAAYHIGRVKRKLATGVYQTEPVACFCGSTHAQLVTDTDRYGFDHAMWFCRDCGIIYANPRMTEASYAEFYATEYRPIYDQPEDTADLQFERGRDAAHALQTYLAEQHLFRPAVVFDIGCNAGGWLKPFLDAGAEVHGVDYGPERIASGKVHGLPIEVGSIETLEVMGVQADLIMMNHVLEHATNLESTLARIRALLKDEGLVYISCPGLFMFELTEIFQNAHPWQFTAETLVYVMECCGFEEIRCDHGIVSLWKKSEIYRDKDDRPTKFLRDIWNYLYQKGTRFIPHVRTVNKFSKANRQASVVASTSRGLPEITDVIDRHVGQKAIIVSGGPSVDGQRETITRLKVHGAVLICIERMYPWCHAQGFTPDYVVIQDASDDVTEALTDLRPGSIFLASSQCPPAVFDALEGHPTYFFHTSHDLSDAVRTGPGPKGVLLNAGGSVSLCSLSLAMLMGIQEVHVCGFDCHVTNGGYAQGIAGVGEQADFIQVKIDGRAFRTTPTYLAFAQQFFDLYEIGKRDGLLEKITVYGDSMITAMSREPIGA